MPLALAFSLAVFWKYFTSTTPQCPLGQLLSSIYVASFCIPLYVLINNTLYWFTNPTLWQENTCYRSLLFTPVSHCSPRSRGICQTQPNPPHWRPITPAVKCPNFNSPQDLTGSGVWPWLFLSLVIWSFRSLNWLLLGLLHLLFPIHGTIVTSASLSSWRSQLQCQLFLTTMVKPPAQSSPNTKLCVTVNTDFFGTPCWWLIYTSTVSSNRLFAL